jgi:proteasome lid subunit RPN8/RPN11
LSDHWREIDKAGEEIAMKVLLFRKSYDSLIEHARAMLPEEACGLIAGHDRPDGVREIVRVYGLTNTDHSPEHFSIDPKEHLLAIRDMRARGLRPLGNWHSHPVTPSRPSDEDIRLAYNKEASYLIVSLADEEPVLHAFHIEDGTSKTEELQVVSGSGQEGDLLWQLITLH